MSGGWISVEERVPEEGQKVLVYGLDLYGPFRMIAVYQRPYKDGPVEWTSPWDTDIGDRVSHWQPWPKDPV